jgi:hypothetical protein
MTDSCVITRAGDVGVDRDPVTGAFIPATDSPVYSGACRLKTVRTANPIAGQLAGDFPVTSNATISIPIGAALLQNRDVAVITASEFEPWNVGKRFRVTTPNLGSQRTADRWQVEVITG